MADQQDDLSLRDQALVSSKIDEEYISRLLEDAWSYNINERGDYLERFKDYEESWRNLAAKPTKQLWEDSANFHIPSTLTYGKAIVARLWQLFSSPNGLYQVKARKSVFAEKEAIVKQFMDFVITSWVNGKLGMNSELEDWLWDVVFNGHGYLKGGWKREEFEYLDVVPQTESESEVVFDVADLTGRENLITKVVEKEVEKTEVMESPQVRRARAEDIILPRGCKDPQDAPWFVHILEMTNDEMKARVEAKKFYKSVVEEVIDHTSNPRMDGSNVAGIKQQRADIDGIDDMNTSDKLHVVLEYVGKAYVEAGEVKLDDFENNLNKKKREVIVWYHKDAKKVLGWTYLHRVSPRGVKPLFRANFLTFPDREDGVGVAELLFESSRYKDAVFNLRYDNGTLASIPMFAYRTTSNSLKPQNLRIRPGLGIPVDDINDVKQFSFPFLTNFGYQEEAHLDQMDQSLLAISEINLGRAPDKVGALRNATGANLLSSESGIQLEPHFGRIARCMSQLLQYLFTLCRERIPGELFFRVTGERGEPIFGRVNREDLEGDFDFDIGIDILGQSQTERQQQSVLVMQTLINPAFMQSGVVTPTNLYNLSKNFLKAYKIGRIDDFLTQPQGYSEIVTPIDRLSRIAFGFFQDPPIEDTVRLEEDHEKALRIYKGFEDSIYFGLFDTPAKLQAYHRLQAKHEQLLAAQQAGGNPNMAGTQVPRDGMPPVNNQIGSGGGGPLQAPPGEVNGPVV